jgi:molybdopterin synthase catalytic subunit
MDYLKLTFDKLDPTMITELVAHESCGAVSMFAGTTRDNFEGKEVKLISFQFNNFNNNFNSRSFNLSMKLTMIWLRKK